MVFASYHPNFLGQNYEDLKKDKHRIFDVKSSQMFLKLEENRGKSFYDENIVSVPGDEFRAPFFGWVDCYCIRRREQKCVIW